MSSTFIHLEEINQSYCEHFRNAFSYSMQSLKCSFYFLIHAFWPDCFQHDGSESIKELHETIESRK
jgi:hypothetical protein